MLRSELVYRLKKSIEQNPDFTLDQFEHVLVDEYQDLNRCDIEVVRALANAGGQLFVAGDDDQSIYGFRFAFPQGIRAFENEYSPCRVLTLEQCVRCDADILRLGLFVAKLDPNRIEKSLRSQSEKGEGEVRLLSFGNQADEAEGVAQICKYLVEHERVDPGEILVLTRTDRYGAFSTVLRDTFTQVGVPAVNTPLLDRWVQRVKINNLPVQVPLLLSP
jgi:DNA helicase-2/ATP-dependent DNA helicase PcrA